MKTGFSPLWLDYREIESDLKSVGIVSEHNGSKPAVTAVSEIKTALGIMLPNAEIIEGEAQYTVKLSISEKLGSEEYSIVCSEERAEITGGDGNGLLYSVFAFLREAMRIGGLPVCEERVSPMCAMRMYNHWDDPNGFIERGYAGSSFYFENGQIKVNDRTRMFARAAASTGINGIVINNVNVRAEACRFITEEYYGSLGALSEIFDEYGIKLYLSADFAAPMTVGGLASADPLDGEVISWWQSRCEGLFSNVKNIGGFLIKADSEGRAGPFTYGRTHADGANMLARAVKPYGGCIIWRCFVYNCRQDWRDRKTDRARAAYDNFLPLDGKFDVNVILQVKNGPMDFQVREPVHPLFGAMKNTNLMLEVQAAQEYTGQQRHVCCLLPMFREILDFHTFSGNAKDTVADIISSRGKFCGIAAVTNTGDDFNWTGSDLAAANLYGFGRIAFEKDISPESIINEWCALTLGTDNEVMEKVSYILKNSRKAYEDYTVPLGIGWMCTPSVHYGPSPLGYEYDRWGTYHFADRNGIGVDRSSSGTGYAMLYNQPLADIYNNPESCPDELKLFFHRLPYTYVLKSGKTLIQHVYDTHFEGCAEAEKFAAMWESIREKLPERIYKNGAERFKMQTESAREWRDIINSFFFRFSGIPDEKGREIY